MDNKRGFETGRLNELLLDALTEGAKFSDVLERIYAGTGLATAILDMDGSVTLCAPMDAERLSPLLAAMRSRADGKMAGLLRGEVLTFLPGEAGEGAALCRLVPAGGEPRHILALSLPLGTQASQGEKALDRISQLYAYYINGSGVEPQRHCTSYLESGLARELILGDRDIANSVFGNLYDLRFGGSSGVLEPGYVFSALGGAPVQELAEAEQALMRVLPNSFHLINNERLFVFISGVKREQYGQMLGRLAFFAENSSLRCGVSDVFDDLEERSGFRRQAEQALRLAEDYLGQEREDAPERYWHALLEGEDPAQLADSLFREAQDRYPQDGERMRRDVAGLLEKVYQKMCEQAPWLKVIDKKDFIIGGRPAEEAEEIFKELQWKIKQYGLRSPDVMAVRIARLIEEYLVSDHLQDILAEKLELSKDYIAKLFRGRSGMTISEYTTLLKMEKAKELLCSTNMKVAQVSEKVGFSNVSYFCRSFREYYGSSPESYRKGTGDDEENPKEI